MQGVRAEAGRTVHVWIDGARQTHVSGLGIEAHDEWKLNVIEMPANSPEVKALAAPNLAAHQLKFCTEKIFPPTCCAKSCCTSIHFLH